MEIPAAVHNTFVIERSYARPPEKVFAAFRDPAKKRRWYAQSEAHDVVSYELDFRVGGAETLAGKMKPRTPIPGTVLTWSQVFQNIIENRRIVFTQTLDFGDKRISCAVITAEFIPDGAGCKLVFTHQAVFFEGADGPQMREYGWKVLLDRWGKEAEQG